MNETRAHLLVRCIEDQADHQATPTNFKDMTVRLLKLTQLVDEISSNLIGILHKMLLLEDIEHCKSCSTSEMVASERCTELSDDRWESGRDKHGSHRQAIGNTLGHGDKIRLDSEPLMGKELTATTIATLDLIADQHGTIFLASLGQTLGKLRRSHDTTAYTLDTFENHSTDIAFSEFFLPRFEIIHGKEGHLMVIVDRCEIFLVIRDLHSKRSTAMERVLHSEHPTAPVVKAGELQCILVSLSSTVDQEKTIVFIATDLSKTLSQLLLQGVDDTVGVESDLLHLIVDSLDIMRMTVTNADDCMTAIEVQILLSFIVPYAGSFAPYDIDVE